MCGIIIFYCFLFLANLLTSGNSQTTATATDVIIILTRERETKPMSSQIKSPETPQVPVTVTTSTTTLKTPRNGLIGLDLSPNEKVEETVRRGFHVFFPLNRFINR